jgi:hypothetical protein
LTTAVCNYPKDPFDRLHPCREASFRRVRKKRPPGWPSGGQLDYRAPMSDAQQVTGWDSSPRLRADDKLAQRLGSRSIAGTGGGRLLAPSLVVASLVMPAPLRQSQLGRGFSGEYPCSRATSSSLLRPVDDADDVAGRLLAVRRGHRRVDLMQPSFGGNHERRRLKFVA